MKKNNFLQKRPKIRKCLTWEKDSDETVTLKIENTGIMTKLFRKTRYSYVHLDKIGSFVWVQLDGKSDIYIIGKKTEAEFGEKTTPLFERLVKFLNILESYKLIEWAK